MSPNMRSFTSTESRLADVIVSDIGRSRSVLWSELTVAVRPLDITARQVGVLLKLGRDDGLSAAELSRSLHIDSSMLTRLADALQARQLIDRTHDRDDRRVIRLRLTDRGRSVVNDLHGIVRECVRARFGHFTADELQELHRLLDKLLLGHFPQAPTNLDRA